MRAQLRFMKVIEVEEIAVSALAPWPNPAEIFCLCGLLATVPLEHRRETSLTPKNQMRSITNTFRGFPQLLDADGRITTRVPERSKRNSEFRKEIRIFKL
jgi:hypothetical protein